tara:strand:- start:380 stop:736 length:357 start_codon:yes stop_codon:yes gene_type:complete
MSDYLNIVKKLLSERMRLIEEASQIVDTDTEELNERYHREGVSPDELRKMQTQRSSLSMHRLYLRGKTDAMNAALDTIEGCISSRDWEGKPARKVMDLQWEIKQTEDELAESQEGERT